MATSPPQLRLFDESSAGGPLTLDELCEEYFAQKLGRRMATRQQVELTLARVHEFVRACLLDAGPQATGVRAPPTSPAWRPSDSSSASLSVEELSDEFLGAFMAWRLKKVTPATVNKDFRNIRSLWLFAAKRPNKYRVPPFRLEELPVEKRLKHCWSLDEVKLILMSCDQEGDLFLDVPAPLWWRALVTLIYDTALRLNALLSTTWGQVEETDDGRLFLWVRAGHQKQRADQAFELTHAAAAVRALRKALAREPRVSEPILSWPYDKNQVGWPTLWMRLKRILKRAGLSATREDLFHKLRRTHATYHLRECGSIAEVQAQLGHSDVKVTWAYIDPTKCGRAVSGRSLPSIE